MIGAVRLTVCLLYFHARRLIKMLLLIMIIMLMMIMMLLRDKTFSLSCRAESINLRSAFVLEPKDGQTKQRQRLFPIFVSALRAAPFLYFLCISLLYFYGTFSTFFVHCCVPLRSSISLLYLLYYIYYWTFMFACI